MPYIMVDEVPEGTEAVDVVLRTEYDAVVQERDRTIEQRDEALRQVEESQKMARETRAKYADAILTANRETPKAPEPSKAEPPKLKMSTNALFAM